MNKNLVKLLLIIAIILILIIEGYFIMKHFITFNVKDLSENEEKIIDYNNKNENIQSYESSGEILNETEGVKKYKDSNGDIAYIPENFKVSEKKDEQTINTGLVVIRTRWK